VVQVVVVKVVVPHQAQQSLDRQILAVVVVVHATLRILLKLVVLAS
jgi:hypothetical protein